MRTKTIAVILVALATVLVACSSDPSTDDRSDLRVQLEKAIPIEKAVSSPLDSQYEGHDVERWVDTVSLIDDWHDMYEDDVQRCIDRGDIPWQYYQTRLNVHLAHSKALVDDVSDGDLDDHALKELEYRSGAVEAIVGAINARCDLRFAPDHSVN